MRVFILGAGRAGIALAVALREGGATVIGVHGRQVPDAARARSLGIPESLPVSAGALPQGALSADAIVVTVRDAQLNEALAELGEVGIGRGSVVLHASGSAEPSGAQELRARGVLVGTFHPLVPLTGGLNASRILARAWIGIDGDEGARSVAVRLAGYLGSRVMQIPPGQKLSYHAAAVLASNFPAVLAHLATRRLESAGVSASDAASAVISLMYASVDNLQGHNPASALTGPVVRGDVATVRGHLEVLERESDEAALAVYTALTHVAVQMARELGVDAGTLAQIEGELWRHSSR